MFIDVIFHKSEKKSKIGIVNYTKKFYTNIVNSAVFDYESNYIAVYLNTIITKWRLLWNFVPA